MLKNNECHSVRVYNVYVHNFLWCLNYYGSFQPQIKPDKNYDTEWKYLHRRSEPQDLTQEIISHKVLCIYDSGAYKHICCVVEQFIIIYNCT